jgi:hypothetical protein
LDSEVKMQRRRVVQLNDEASVRRLRAHTSR